MGTIINKINYKNNIMKFKINILVVFIVIFLSCNKQEKTTTILLSIDNSKAVSNWLLTQDSTLNIVILYNLSVDSIDLMLKKADGIVITGGEDVNPALYNQPEMLPKCGEINQYRDSLEYKMINYALENKIPLLGICRGLQIMNVSQGGSLFVDIPSQRNSNIHRNNGAVEHYVYLLDNSELKNSIKKDSGLVYSNHHQAIDNLADIFRVTSFAVDSIIESIDIIDTSEYNFAMAVQWHPEAMNYDDDFSKPIATEFLKASRSRVRQ